MIVRTALAFALSLALLSLRPAHADPLDQQQPFVRLSPSRPATVEASWTPMRMPTGERISLLGMSYLAAVNEDWGFGPSVYGAAQGNFGGLLTAGVTAQRRWRLGQSTHLALGLYAGAGAGHGGGGMVDYGNGLMLRPELSIRTEFDRWYLGLSLVHVRFPGGTVSDSSVGLVLGRATGFASFSPADAGSKGVSNTRLGMGFDEITVFGGYYKPDGSARDLAGQPFNGDLGFVGADLRQYIAPGSWWGMEAAGAAQGGRSGYMDILANAGQDWALGSGSPLRIGAQLGIGLGGGAGVDTGSGWIVRAGPALRWQTPWGPSLRLEGGYTRALSGNFGASYWRLGLSLPLDPVVIPATDDRREGIVREQQASVNVQHLSQLRMKDGSEAKVDLLMLQMRRDLAPWLYATGKAGSAATGQAVGFSTGQFGLGLQTPALADSLRFGAELLIGAAGGGGVAIGGGGTLQAEAWAQWQWEHLRLRAGVGQWRTLGDNSQSSPLLSLSLGYASGMLGR